MAQTLLVRLLPEAPQTLLHILDGQRGPVPAPVRAEIYGQERFAQHGRRLAESHRAERGNWRSMSFFPRLRSNIVALREAHTYIGHQASSGYDISPAGEWLLDNFHLIEGQLKAIHEGLPRRYFQHLPLLLEEPLAGLPRIYGVAWAFVAHTDGAFDEDLALRFLTAYQEVRELNLAELWALPTTLRVVLIENLRRLAERVATNKAAREIANLCSDRLHTFSIESLDELLAELNRRGVGRTFLGQMAQRLQDLQRTSDPLALLPYQHWLQAALPDTASLLAQQAADQAADNLSVSNAVTSLRTIGDADWPDIIGRSSLLMQLMMASPIFAAEHITTRDSTLHGIERLARRSGRSETLVGKTLLGLMQHADPAEPEAAVAFHWLHGPGRPRLLAALDLREDGFTATRAWLGRHALPLYLGSLLLVLAGVVALMLSHAPPSGRSAPLWLGSLAALLMLFPASEAVVAVINRLVSESVRPQHLPRLALNEGIPPEHRVMVVVPALLTGELGTQALAHRLLLHHLANPERHAQFALLTDWADAEAAHMPTDGPLLRDAVEQVRALNQRYPAGEGDPPRFLVLHRQREFSATEQRWIGWERKRGKLEQLIAALALGERGPFLDLGIESQIAAGTRYVVTLDSDTGLPPGRLRELVGVAAHPHNQPQVDPALQRVVSGYGILQPRIATPLPSPQEVTPFHWVFAGQPGVDPYSTPSSEVYQDLFGEGTYTGKGLLHVQAMHAVLDQRLPEGLVLSHDLLEGSIARCATLTDLAVIEDAPFHADVAASRIHRWTRGDWQLLPLFLSPRLYPLAAVSRWKMFDNLRRSLVAPASLALLLVMLARPVVSPLAALLLVLAAFCGGPLLGAVAGFSPVRDDVAPRHFYRGAALDLARALCTGLWHLAQLLQQALMSLDAISRSLHRMLVSRRNLLQWTTAAAAAASAETELKALVRRHWQAPAAAVLLLGLLLAVRTPHPWLAAVLCALWAGAPVWTWWFSRPRPRREDQALPAADRTRLEGIARDTWRLFERCVGPEDRYLPPDNLQTLPHDMVAHRTSPTNIGLYLLSCCCARAFGWIGTQDLLARLEATLDTLDTLERHRGHFLNWYDTQSGATLLPQYVSTVDSGNLCGHLLAVAQACRELAPSPQPRDATRHALQASRERLKPLLQMLPELFPVEGRAQAAHPLARLLAMADPLAEAERDGAAFSVLLHEAEREREALLPDGEAASPDADPGGEVPARPARPRLDAALAWQLADHLATLRSALRDLEAAHDTAGLAATSQRLLALAERCEQLAWAPDFGFLFHRKRHLFHIGFRVAEQQLDTGFYDLLASEARLTSLLAVAKGEVPVSHWASLGRPLYAVGTQAGLRSWSGSMFEYLMPSLVLHEPHGSVLRDAGLAAVREQIDFARAHHVPWGISESAYAGRDHTLAYQYAPQGVPRLALRRTPPDELVIAPYATALAAQVAPRRSAANFAALEALGARARYGYIEALDFTPARLAAGEAYAPVGTFMAHHQGMSIVAIANVLLHGQAQRWGMASPHIEAVCSLLHERAPREVSRLYEPLTPPPPVQARRGPTLLRELMPGTTALEPTHVLSNGRYSVSLRANGAGWSRRGAFSITRSRDDALRDAHGSFFYLRLPGRPQPVSITQHPAPDPGAWYRSVFHADRVCFDAAWKSVQTHVTVWVSPEDDIEFRQVELRNLSDSPLEVELISAFEVSLADPRADEAHPAFANLFVRAEWLASQQALLFERKPRLVTEQGLQAAHFLAESDPQVTGVHLQTDRLRWWGRNHGPTRPMATLDEPPSPVSPDTPVTLDTGLDPVCVLAVTLRIAPNAKAQLTFATAASDSPATLRAVVDKYRQASHVQRASLMSATLTGIRLRSLAVSAENFAAVQTLTTALALSLSRPRGGPPRPHGRPADVCDRRLLWRFGISGDRPIVLVSAGLEQSLGLLRSLAQALRIWGWGRVPCDLVVVNSEPASYVMLLQREITALRDRHEAENAAQPGPACTGLHLLRADDLSPEEMGTLRSLARIRLRADGRPLVHHVQEWLQLHEEAYDERNTTAVASVRMARLPAAPVAVASGTFDDGSGEFRFDAGAQVRPPRPWINVLSNPAFGGQVSEAGGGYTWAVNSRLNQLTAWSNDPVADPPSEWFLVQDRKSQEAWSVTPSAWGDERLTYQVAHGQGYTLVRHQRGELAVTTSWCVDAATSVKQVWLRLENRGSRALPLRVVGIAEWMMGAARSDRGTVHTSAHHQRLPDRHALALLATQADRTAGYGNGTAFLALAGSTEAADDWTCDRRECFDARGRLVLPDHFGQQQGGGLDPCAALSSRFTLEPGEVIDRVFLLGYGDTPEAARQLAVEALAVPPRQRLNAARDRWDTLLGATQVLTPDPLFDALVNRWLLYQTVACRLWAKAGFYQAGGATGFRDQLQDAMALAWPAPQMLRDQIIVAASRQFPEGDVQHWWHAPGGAGVRTHFSDDLLWLAHACVHYLRSTGDRSLLDERVPFLEGAQIPEGAEDAYYTPTISDQDASVFEHAARAIDRSLRNGEHGLPLMGTGDWNDGMNRVGHEGKGESVWLAWFLCRLVDDFAPLARERGEVARAERWEAAARGWRQALATTAWDGQWFKRAFFDDGTPLGSHVNGEGRIDLIAQAWSVLAGAAPGAEPTSRPRIAMTAVEELLVDHDAGLVKLLDPPLVSGVPSAGYIQAYPPGVRENGGQYSHAGVWALMAQAELARSPQGTKEGAELPYRYFCHLSPAHRAMHPTHGAAYAIEPYVMAGDVYTQPPYVGRGGWSWYTGAAAWLHRAALSSILGLRLEAETLSFVPCLPAHWPEAELHLRRDGRHMHFVLLRGSTLGAQAAARDMAHARVLQPGEVLRWRELPAESRFIVRVLETAAEPAPLAQPALQP
ncbi:MAG: carbohydrate-binding protein [Rhizobacter sp.]|nr:carbohydrate-binding protein [Rhizobacter sp.]